ncbi:MAG: putative zinc-binding peptidase [Bacteroidota bacterium]
MKLFTCQYCGQLLYFENIRCERCGSPLGFSSDNWDLLTLWLVGDQQFQKYNHPDQQYRYCANHQYQACNWLVPVDDSHDLCFACQFNQTIPDLQDDSHLQRWREMEEAKRRLLYSLQQMGLPLITKEQDSERGLAFDFLADETLPTGERKRVLTGHAQGLITININEADGVQREEMKQKMGERYRTLLGHFRHEVGHYYWNILIVNTDFISEYRELFGDERQDYQEALQKHYKLGSPENWSEQFISSYASSHSWEDWAETWSHYLHILDTLDTAYSFGLEVKTRIVNSEALAENINFDPYQMDDFDQIWDQWLPSIIAINSINRSMGHPDTYPFVVPEPVLKKLGFIHKVCRASRRVNVA